MNRFAPYIPYIALSLSLVAGCDRSVSTNRGTAGDEHGSHDHAHGDHAHDHGAEDPNRLKLSAQAQRNIGLKSGPVKLQPFERTVTIPGIIVERPGRTSIAIGAPLSGAVSKIIAVEGEAVSPGQPLFMIRLTHEEIVQAQGEFLQTAAELDVIAREVARLERVAAEGAVAGKTFLERKYEQEKRQAALQAQREALLMHGLSEAQVDSILADRKLLKGLTVFAPEGFADDTHDAQQTIWQVQELDVSVGQHVNAGDTLAELTDYCTLFIEGKAFEQDSQEVLRAVKESWPVTAVFDATGDEPLEVTGLKLAYTSGRVDLESRAFHFYVTLPNRLLRDATNGEGHRSIDWEFKPGQRVDLRLPVEKWTDRIVVPVDAIARDGAESYVFQVSGDTFVRRPVHEEFRDPMWAVIANDGSIFPDDVIAMSGAQQMQIALKNKSGGGIDPHAGHSH